MSEIKKLVEDLKLLAVECGRGNVFDSGEFRRGALKLLQPRQLDDDLVEKIVYTCVNFINHQGHKYNYCGAIDEIRKLLQGD